jgi:hypothetical protein
MDGSLLGVVVVLSLFFGRDVLLVLTPEGRNAVGSQACTTLATTTRPSRKHGNWGFNLFRELMVESTP